MKPTPAAPVTVLSADELKEIKHEHAQMMGAVKSTILSAIRLGELLLKQKSALKHGQWLDWVGDHLPFSERAAQDYIRCYENRTYIKSKHLESVKQAIQLLTNPTPEKPKESGKSEASCAFGEKPKESGDSIDVGEVTDDRKYPIPATVLPVWNRRGEFNEYTDTLKSMISQLNEARDTIDPLWLGVHIQGLCIDLDKIVDRLAGDKPYVVCTTCQGHPEVQPKGQCPMCKGRGLIGKYMWNTVPESFRKIRDKAVK